MEMFSLPFRDCLPLLLEASIPVLATAHGGDDDFVADILARDDVTAYVLRPTEREALLEVIDGLVGRILADS
jgi:nucleoside-triphosphatase THEP1